MLISMDTLQIVKVLSLSLGNSTLQLPPEICYGIKYQRLARPIQDGKVLVHE